MRQLRGRQGAAVHQGVQHSCAGRITRERRDLCKPRIAGHGSNPQERVPAKCEPGFAANKRGKRGAPILVGALPRCFGRHRTMLALFPT
jgi:hypothetical protein